MSEFDNAKRRTKYASEEQYRETMKQRALAYKDANRDKVRRYYREYDKTRKNRNSGEAVEHV